MGVNRKMQRSTLKAEYARFCEAWNNEKMYQRILIADGAKIETVDGPKRDDGYPTAIQVIKNGDTHLALLGKKPTFSMWLNAKKNKRSLADVEKSMSEKQVEVTNKEW